MKVAPELNHQVPEFVNLPIPFRVIREEVGNALSTPTLDCFLDIYLSTRIIPLN